MAQRMRRRVVWSFEDRARNSIKIEAVGPVDWAAFDALEEYIARIRKCFVPPEST